jgi:predicted RNase H-like HicB family nuclease
VGRPLPWQPSPRQAPTKPGRVTVAGNDGDEIKPGTLYAVVIEGEEGSYSAWSPDLPGCVATGGSLDEVEQRMRGTIEFHLEGLRLDGHSIPRPSAVATVVIPVPAA